MLKLIFASIVLLTSFANARSIRLENPVVFAIDHKLKIDVDQPTWRFQMRSDGSWTYVQMKKQTVTKRASGRLPINQVHKIQRLLNTKWEVTTADVTCMAFAAQFTEYSVNGGVVWKDEMCSGESLDKTSTRRLTQVMSIVRPLLRA